MIENELEHKEGPSWNIASRFATFEEADKVRTELLLEEDMQVKVQWLRKTDMYAVKTRYDRTEEELREKREAKRRRKKKLNKKRRKK
jgi:hypothetical protein